MVYFDCCGFIDGVGVMRDVYLEICVIVFEFIKLGY